LFQLLLKSEGKVTVFYRDKKRDKAVLYKTIPVGGINFFLVKVMG
jgi:hypothetical protein